MRDGKYILVNKRRGDHDLTKEFIGYVGTYTRKSSRGIYRFELDIEAKELTDVQLAHVTGSPTYLAISKNEKRLYAVAQADEMGGVSSYEIQEDGKLRYMNRKLSKGAPPCHVDIRDQALLSGNYHKGTVTWYEINEQGSIHKEITSEEHEGCGPHERQEKPHVHFTGHTPDGKYVLVVDLGTDELVTYIKKNQALIKLHTFKTKAGSGPRHIAFHPNGKTAYLLTELSSEVIVLDYKASNGSFIERQVLRVIPEDFTETNDASAIHVSSDGKFVYTANRGHNSIAVFQADETTGNLTFVEYTNTAGEFPRDFTLDPSEAFIVVANQHTGNLVLFERDEQTGKLTKLDSEINVPEAVCVKFLKKEFEG